MKKGIIIRIRFNSYKISDERLNKDWIDYRMNILTNYLIKNLINQSSQEYLCFIEYDKACENLIKESILKFDLPDNIIFTGKLSEEIKKYVDNYDVLYFVKLNSDNLYDLNTIKYLKEYEPKNETKILTFNEGFIYDLPTGKLSYTNNKSNVFYVYICSLEEYYKYFNIYDGFYPTNLDMKFNLMPKEVLKDRLYMILTHLRNNRRKFLDNNIIYDKEKKELILKKFIVK